MNWRRRTRPPSSSTRGRLRYWSGKNGGPRTLRPLRRIAGQGESPLLCLCEFMDQAPHGFPAPELASRCSRQSREKWRKWTERFHGKFGGVAWPPIAVTANRGVSAEGKAEGKRGTKTDFCIVCDADGIRFFFLAADPKVGEVTRGFASGGSYEGIPWPPVRAAVLHLSRRSGRRFAQRRIPDDVPEPVFQDRRAGR